MSNALGSYISHKDMDQILSKGIRSKEMKNSYFNDLYQARVKRAFGHMEEFSRVLLQNSNFPVKTIMKAEAINKTFIERFVERFEKYKYYRKEIILIYQVAVLDNLLSIGLSIKEFNSIKKILGFEKSKTFTFMSMRYKQKDIERGCIKERI